VFCRSLFVICPYSFGYCIACPSSIDDFWLPFWHIQTRIDNYVLADVYLKFRTSKTNKQKPWLYMLVNKLKYDIHVCIQICALHCQIKLNIPYCVSISQLRDPSYCHRLIYMMALVIDNHEYATNHTIDTNNHEYTIDTNNHVYYIDPRLYLLLGL
jgi:hypothetical protein